jgi:hypothetical protein
MLDFLASGEASMKRCLHVMLLAVALSISVPAIAGVKDIRKEKLPPDSAVAKVYADVEAIEEYVRVWSDSWPYPVPKNEVASRLKTSLAELQKALTSTPDNEELLLLTGLVAQYAHNVDVEGAPGAAESSFEKARKIAPGDFRADWFLAVFRCESGLIKQGMEAMLALEASRNWSQLPSSFWDDYLYCALIANMPAHALRASNYATKLQASSSKDRDVLLDLARKRFTTPDSAATYGAHEVWTGENRGLQTIFTSTMFGISFSSQSSWRAKVADVSKGVGMIQFQTDPHPGKFGQVYPNILVIVRQPKLGESLADFQQSILQGKSAKSIPATTCPSQDCLAAEIVEPAGYKTEGDAHFVMTVFKRDSPEFPGLLFEVVSGPPISGSDQPQYFRSTERLHRLDGPLYYLVGLDSADSVLVQAKSDYEAFLKSIQVE